MNEELAHLDPRVWSYFDDSVEDRIRACYLPRWIRYPRGDEALARLTHLLAHPPCPRMPCLLIYGDSGIGKTMIIEKVPAREPTYSERVR
jgi:hypothetical protein